MISLKRYLEQRSDKLPLVSSDAYLATLEAIAAGALRCCPPTGEVLKRELFLAAEPLKNGRSAAGFKSTQQQVLKSLRSWSEQSEAYFARKTAEVKEILTELAGTAEFIGKRDRQYTRQFNEITFSLQTIAQLEDITRIRTSLLRSAGELKGCVERMAREGNQSIAQLEASLASRRVELEQARELAALDPLTGLYNRREVEARIARKLTGESPFCVVIVDLNNFRHINEKHGHIAGDEVLRQIANELRMASRAQDILGRWGGDEFVLVVDGNFSNTKIKVQRMRPWVFGTYELDLAGTIINVVVSASIGMAEWSPGETMLEVLSRAVHDAEHMPATLAARDILALSSNPGTAQIALRSGAQRQREFLGHLGLLSAVRSELPERQSPIYPRNNWGEVETATIGFGHGISVTPLAFVTAAATIVNGGRRIVPTFLKHPEDARGEQLIKPETSATMRGLLRYVVTNGTGKKADVPGYDVGGKTGSAEKNNGHVYVAHKLITSFCGVFPIDDPRYLVFVMLDEPHGTKETFGVALAGFTAAPLAGKVIARIAPMLGVPPAAPTRTATKENS